MNPLPADEIRTNKSFEDMEKILCSKGAYEFFGLPMDQAPNALRLINLLLVSAKPEKIIEFGTGRGGLSALLSMYASINGIQFSTYDCGLYDQHILRHFQDSSSFRWADLARPEVKEEIKHTILQATKGPVILFCDALKSIEFDYYSDFCKPGDFLLVHDYSSVMGSTRWYDVCKETGWTAPQEQCYANIKAACDRNNILPFMHDEFEGALWYCGTKVKTILPSPTI